ncbi:hypothetical protein ACVWXN_003436 [Bradyrhizobium sp. i1.4.4]
MTEQFDMFAAAASSAAPPAPAVAPIAGVHWLHVTTKRAATACGIHVPAFYKHLGAGYAASGEKITCTTNRDDGTVTCLRCLEEMT